MKNIIADVVPGQGRAIVLLSHYDSVPAGPGAADDASGVATILETVRALKVRNGKSLRAIIAVITDGEEAGLIGANALLAGAEFRERVGVVVNMEARGNDGPSQLFQTSPGDSPLIDLYKASVDSYETSSLFSVIYKFLPNETDLTPFIAAKYPSFNFAFSGNVAHNHTPLDRRENLDRATLQHHGDNLLGIVNSLQTTPLETLRGGGDDVYVPIFGRWLPRIPAGWALPVALFAFVLLLVTVVLSRVGSGGVGAWAKAAAIVPAILIGPILVGWGLHSIASLVSGQPDPSYAYPTAMRFSLTAGVFLVFLACTRLGDAKRSALVVWLWMGAVGVLTALFVPGLSPYFVFPTLVASVLLLAQTRSAEPWTGRAGQIALAAAAVLPLVLWIGLAVVGESVQGLMLHPLFTLPVAFGMIALVPLAGAEAGSLTGALSKRAWRYALAGTAALAVLLAIVQGTRPAFSATSPQRLSISFVDDHAANEAYWVANTDAVLPASLRAVAPFSAKPAAKGTLIRLPAYTALAGAPRFVAPTADITEQPSAGGRTVTLAMHTSEDTAQVMLAIPKGAGLRAVTVNGTRQQVADLGDSSHAWLWCMSRDCQRASIVLEVGTAAFDLSVASVRFGLPPDGQKLVDARPKEAVPSQNGDSTVVSTTLHVNGS